MGVCMEEMGRQRQVRPARWNVIVRNLEPELALPAVSLEVTEGWLCDLKDSREQKYVRTQAQVKRLDQRPQPILQRKWL